MKEKVIIALDFDDLNEAKDLVDQLPEAIFFKVGLQAFLKFGPQIISYLHENQKKIFLDLKFKDIPNTVFGAVNSSIAYSPRFLTIHLSGGGEMIRRAIEAASYDSGITILGVTVLTSLSDEDMLQIGSNLSAAEVVFKLIELGLNNGLKAFVCSPQEVKIIREKFGEDPILVTPGIRPQWAAKGDQKRVFTPKMAIKSGSDFLVIGRPITRHLKPSAAFFEIIRELNPLK